MYSGAPDLAALRLKHFLATCSTFFGVRLGVFEGFFKGDAQSFKSLKNPFGADPKCFARPLVVPSGYGLYVS